MRSGPSFVVGALLLVGEKNRDFLGLEATAPTGTSSQDSVLFVFYRRQDRGRSHTTRVEGGGRQRTREAERYGEVHRDVQAQVKSNRMRY